MDYPPAPPHSGPVNLRATVARDNDHARHIARQHTPDSSKTKEHILMTPYPLRRHVHLWRPLYDTKTWWKDAWVST